MTILFHHKNVIWWFFVYNFYLKIVSGTICGGHCCSNVTEDELMIKSTNNFDRELRHHTRSLRNSLESTAKTFRGEFNFPILWKYTFLYWNFCQIIISKYIYYKNRCLTWLFIVFYYWHSINLYVLPCPSYLT